MDADALRAEGMRLYNERQLNEAIAAFEQARAEYAAQGNAQSAASVANDLAVAYLRVGRVDDARHGFAETIVAAQDIGDVSTEAKATGNLAQVLERQGKRDEAEKSYRRAADLFHAVGDKDLEAATLQALSRMELSRGHWLEALVVFDRVLELRGRSGALRAFLRIPLRLLGIR